LFNQRKNKRFSYKTRFQDSNTDSHREESKDDFDTKWNKANGDSKRKGNVFTSLPALLIVLVSLFVLIYILEGYMK